MTNHGFAYRCTQNPQPKLMWFIKINKLVRISGRLSRFTSFVFRSLVQFFSFFISLAILLHRRIRSFLIKG